jgi:ABC-type sugar transport system permease subunit
MRDIIGKSGRVFLFYAYVLSGSRVPSELYEAANIDGAGSGTICYVTLPSMNNHHPSLSCLPLFGNFTISNLIFVMTGGGQMKVPFFPLLVSDCFQEISFGDASRFAILIFYSFDI